MGKCVYKKPESPDIRGICVLCEKNLQKKTRRQKYQALCNSCDLKRFVSAERAVRLCEKQKKELNELRVSKKPYRHFASLECSTCDFVAKDVCQMDIDHIDGDHENNDPTNLNVLCACCHRLKTKRAKDYIAISKRKSLTTNFSVDIQNTL